MAKPIIQSLGGTSGPGTPGQGRNDLVAGERVDLSDTEPANAAGPWLWVFEDFPLGTSPAIVNPTSATPYFYVDADPTLAGSYVVRETVGAFTAVEILAKPLTYTGGRIPSFLEKTEYDGGGNAKGWHEAVTTFMRSVDALFATTGAHDIGGASHIADTIADLNSKILDATLDGVGDPRDADAIITTAGPTTLAVGSVLDGEYLRRSGSGVVGSVIAHTDTAAIHDNVAAEINAIAAKGTPTTSDLLLIEDAAATNAKKKMTIGDLPAQAGADSTAIHNNVSGEISALTEKETPVDDDHVLIEDSEAGNIKKRVLMSNMLGGGGPIAAALGAYMVKTMSAGLTNMVANDVVTFDTLDVSRGDLVDSGNQFVGLKAGRTYLLQSGFRPTSGSYTAHQWWDVTNGAWLGTAGAAASSSASSHVAHAVVSPDVDITVEVRILLCDTGADTDAGYCYASVIEIGAVQADVVGGLEFMDIIEVDSAGQDFDFGASGDGKYGRALDGDVDESYLIEVYLPDPGGVANFSIQPNSISTNQKSAFIYAGSIGPTDGTAAELRFAGTGSGREVHGTIELQAKTGKNRAFQAAMTDSDGTQVLKFDWNGMWADDTTPITSLRIHGDGATTIKAGARFVLWRRTTSNMRSDVAAVYERFSMETVDPGALTTTERTIGHSIYGGSIVGISARVEDAVTAGTITVNVRIAGVTAFSAVLDTTNSTSHVVRKAIGLHPFAADENISVQYVPSGYDNAGSIPSAVTVQVHMVNNGLVIQNDRVVARTELSAAATEIELTGLNGDLDKEYEIVGKLLISTSAQNIDMAPNGAGTNLATKWSFNGGAASTDAAGQIAGLGATTSDMTVMINFRFLVDRDGGYRMFSGTANVTYNGTNIDLLEEMGVYFDNTANLTTLKFISSVASGILANSWVEIRRVKA